MPEVRRGVYLALCEIVSADGDGVVVVPQGASGRNGLASRQFLDQIGLDARAAKGASNKEIRLLEGRVEGRLS